MSPTLEGKIAIVTGASRSRGIGAQVAYELAKRGAKVSGEHSDKVAPYNIFSFYRIIQLISCTGYCDVYVPQ